MSRLDDLKAKYGDTSRPLTEQEKSQIEEWKRIGGEEMERARFYDWQPDSRRIRIDAEGIMERLQENTVLTEDGSYQWFYYWVPCNVISHERWQELKAAEKQRNREYEAAHTNDTRIPF